MNKSEFEQGRRVRLLVAFDGGEYPAGATGYLNQWYQGGENRDDSWGVVFDQDGDDGHTVVRGTLDSGEAALLTDIVEPVLAIAEEADQLTVAVYSWDDLIEAHQEAVR
jgi:hypothetical protein